MFCDLRGFTGFAERAEPEEVMACCAITTPRWSRSSRVSRARSTTMAGDGIMVFFNDPMPTPDPARRAIDMAVAMRGAS